MPTRILLLETSTDGNGPTEKALQDFLAACIRGSAGLVTRARLFNGAEAGDLARDEHDGILRTLGEGVELPLR